MSVVDFELVETTQRHKVPEDAYEFRMQLSVSAGGAPDNPDYWSTRFTGLITCSDEDER